MNIIFFGSTSDSVLVAKHLSKTYPISAVVTQPARPVGREKTITTTSLETWAREQHIPCLTFNREDARPSRFAQESDVVNALETFKPDILITACFGQKIPTALLERSQHGGLNIHPSLLPRWRGADPVPWTIIAGDAQTGVTISTITDVFDSGAIVAQKKFPVTSNEMPDTLRTMLFTKGAELLVEILEQYMQGSLSPILQQESSATVARKVTREDGYVPWNLVVSAIEGTDILRERRTGLMQSIQEPLPQAIIRLYRALHPWPGIWTTIQRTGVEKRVKLVSLHQADGKVSIDTVQLEGKTPVNWKTFYEAYLV